MNAHARLLARLDAERNRQGWSDRRLAQALGMSPAWISELRSERGGKMYARLDAIAQKLSIDVAELFLPTIARAPDGHRDDGTGGGPVSGGDPMFWMVVNQLTDEQQLTLLRMAVKMLEANEAAAKKGAG